MEKSVFEDAIVEKVIKSEWNKLMELKDSDYLRKTIYPILYPVFFLNKFSLIS